jgi:hypothetical protein
LDLLNEELRMQIEAGRDGYGIWTGFWLDSRNCHGIQKGECAEECDRLSSIFGQDFLGGSNCKYPATATITAWIRRRTFLALASGR